MRNRLWQTFAATDPAHDAFASSRDLGLVPLDPEAFDCRAVDFEG